MLCWKIKINDGMMNWVFDLVVFIDKWIPLAVLGYCLFCNSKAMLVFIFFLPLSSFEITNSIIITHYVTERADKYGS